MQLQSDIFGVPVQVPNVEELSGLGAAYLAGIAMGIYDASNVFQHVKSDRYTPSMSTQIRAKKISGWRNAINMLLSNSNTPLVEESLQSNDRRSDDYDQLQALLARGAFRSEVKIAQRA